MGLVTQRTVSFPTHVRINVRLAGLLAFQGIWKEVIIVKNGAHQLLFLIEDLNPITDWKFSADVEAARSEAYLLGALEHMNDLVAQDGSKTALDGLFSPASREEQFWGAANVAQQRQHAIGVVKDRFARSTREASLAGQIQVHLLAVVGHVQHHRIPALHAHSHATFRVPEKMAIQANFSILNMVMKYEIESHDDCADGMASAVHLVQHLDQGGTVSLHLSGVRLESIPRILTSAQKHQNGCGESNR